MPKTKKQMTNKIIKSKIFISTNRLKISINKKYNPRNVKKKKNLCRIQPPFILYHIKPFSLKLK